MTPDEIEKLVLMVHDVVPKMKACGGDPEVFLVHPGIADHFIGRVGALRIVADADVAPRSARVLSEEQYREHLRCTAWQAEYDRREEAGLNTEGLFVQHPTPEALAVARALRRLPDLRFDQNWNYEPETGAGPCYLHDLADSLKSGRITIPREAADE
jgi:hypothetical protein